MSEERIMILTMLQEGKISSEDAAKLLDALDEAELKDSKNYNPSSNATSIPMEDFDPMEKNPSSDRYKKHEDKFENLSNKINNKAEKLSEEFENWGNNFGEKLENKFGKLGDDIAEGANTFTGKVLDFVDDLVDKGTFVNIFGGYDTVTDNIEKNISIIDNPVLEIQSINGKITVKSWDKETVSIKAVCQLKKGSYDKSSSIYEVIEDGRRFIFKPKYTGNIGIRLDVYIPEKYYDRIFLFTSNGKIEIEDVNSKELLLDTSNASIRLSDLHSDKIKAYTKNGRIVAMDIASELLDAETTNSAIELSDVNSTHVEASTRNGKILSNDVTSDELNLTTSNGQILVQDCISKSVRCKTNNANIKVTDLNTSTLKNVELNTSNGQIDLLFNKKNAEFNIDATTSMGHIDIDIPNLIYTLNNQQQLGNKKILAHSSNYTSGSTSINVIALTSNGSVKIG